MKRPQNFTEFVPFLVLILSITYLTSLGLLSIDFGQHWDEEKIIGSLKQTVETGVVLPHWYNYPSLCYDLGLLTALPSTIATIVRSANGSILDVMREATNNLNKTQFKLQLRSLFLILSLLSALPVYALARRISTSKWTGLVAALCVITSWEFFYHARWIAPDCLMMLFGISSVACQHYLFSIPSSSSRPRFLLLCCSSIFAGLCLGTKYNGGIVFLPLITSILLSQTPLSSLNRSSIIREAFLAVCIAMTVFLLTTPGSLIDPARFVRDIKCEIHHYGVGGHGGYTVKPGGPHFYALIRYLSLSLLSKNQIIAFMEFCFAVIGFGYLFIKNRKVSIWLISLPFAYIGYMSSQKVMIVRNYLVLLPFIAILASLGLSETILKARKPIFFQFLLKGLVLSFLCYNACSITISSLSVWRPNGNNMIQSIENRLDYSQTTFLLSPRTLEMLKRSPKRYSPNKERNLTNSDRFIFTNNEVTDLDVFPANIPGHYKTVWTRSDDINWDYYPSWVGHTRILEIDAKDPINRFLIDHINHSRTGN